MENIIPSSKKRRSHEEYLPFYQKKKNIAIFSVVLLILGGLLLPPKGYAVPFMTARLVVFFILTILWSASILADKLKPMWLQAVAALVIYGIIGWYAYAYVGINFSDLGHVFFNMKVMEGQWPLMMEGLLNTIKLAVVSIFFATLVGIIIAVLRVINNKTLNVILISYLEFARSMPVLVVLMIVYFGLPILNIRLSAFFSGVLVLSLIDGAYISEVFRSGISSIHHTQLEAAYALGMTPMKAMRLVIVPQAFRIVVPPLTNQWVSLLKDTAICSLVSITELLKASMIINTWKANPTPIIMGSLIYLAILIPLTLYTGSLEKKGGRFH
jgi:His/Glu/Gln/Arg/opine family amino acid ABC transporter permease subunit